MPERLDLPAGAGELLSRGAVAELAVADVRHREVFEVAVEPGE